MSHAAHSAIRFTLSIPPLRHRPSPSPFSLPLPAPRRLPHPIRLRRRLPPLRASAFPARPDANAAAVDPGLLERLSAAAALVRSLLPGGTWWRLDRDGKAGGREEGKGVAVGYALKRMWGLVKEDRRIIFAAFASLVLAALSDISIPHFLAASIFSAQSGESTTFYRNTRLLVLLCFTSGICRQSCNTARYGVLETVKVEDSLHPMDSSGRLDIFDYIYFFNYCGLRGCCFGIANMTLVRRMREMLYSALLFQDVSFFDEETVGDLTSRLGADCQQVSRVIGYDLNLISRYALQGTGALIYLLILSWRLALSTLLICSILSAILFFYGQYQKGAAKLTQELAADANEVAQETISLMRTVRVYGTEKHEFGRYTKLLEWLSNISLRQSLAYGFWNLSFNFLYHSTQVFETHLQDGFSIFLPFEMGKTVAALKKWKVIAVLIGGMSIMSGHITAEQLTKFILYCEWLIYSTWSVGDNWSSLMQSIGASEKVFQLMDLLPSKQFLSQGLKLQKLVGRIDFVNLSFYYPTRVTAHALRNVNLSVHPHEVVAIVGLSGSGKSTLVNLLLGLYEPSNGQILVDGFPLRDLDIKSFRESIGYVGQEPRLFRMDVSSNIRYGCTREISHEEVEWAAKQAFVHEFILSLPNGYDTLVDNALLSGGQKQRIAIARAIVRDPTILILDEATSALDAESEHYVKGVLHAVRNGSKTKRTVIVIAHRLSTIQAADRIVVMDSGRIAEMGSHSELIQKDGLYSRLAKRQADAFA